MSISVLGDTKILAFESLPDFKFKLFSDGFAAVALETANARTELPFNPFTIAHRCDASSSTYTVAGVLNVARFVVTFQSYAEYREFCEFYDICLQCADVTATSEAC